MTSWTDRIVGTGEADPRTLRENPRNWRVHPGKQQQAMTEALDELGWIQQVLVNQRTGVVVDGHMRVAVALKHKQTSIPVTYVELSDEEEARVLATLNPLGALAYEDAEAKVALQAQAQTGREALRALAGIAGLDELNPRDGMERDHTAVIAEGDDPEDDAWGDDAWEDDAYTGEAIKLISFIMTPAEYEAVLDALERIGDREGQETNADTVLWLIERYAAQEAMEG